VNNTNAWSETKVAEAEWNYLGVNEQWQWMKSIMMETAQVTCGLSKPKSIWFHIFTTTTTTTATTTAILRQTVQLA